jgi:putative ABC transport system substrate-binding protein
VFIAGAFGALAALLATEAEQARKTIRVGLLAPGSRDQDVEGFLRGMRELGYVEGRNLTVEYRQADGKEDRLRALLAELVALKVDVILTGGTAAQAARETTSTIPVVIGAMGDPIGSGVAASLARPGANIIGLSLGLGEGFGGKLLELLRQLAPSGSQFAILWHPSMRTQFADTAQGAQALGIRLQSFQVQRLEELDGAFGAMVTQRSTGVIVLGDPFMFTHRSRIVTLAARYGLPAIYSLRAFVDSGD